MSVRLRPMSEDEFTAWLPLMRDRYAEDIAGHGGLSPENAAEMAATQIEALFPGGQPSPEQLVFVVEAEAGPVGQLWLAERAEPQHCLFVYELYVDEPRRGRGYGKAAMLLAEEEAGRRGIDRVALNVFGGNEVARRLYQSLGYEENAIAMSKNV
jgi:GNAT superfamily N-acetyltransferase